MSYSLISPQPEGLEADETAILLEDGTVVAISVKRVWAPNNAGIIFHARANLLNEDGSNFVCPNGQSVVTEFKHSASSLQVQELTADVISREMIYAVLGEPLTEVEVDGITAPLIGWGLLDDVNIRKARDMANSTGSCDAGSILGLT